MPVKLKIKVTKDILRRSAKCDSNSLKVLTNCAIALAIVDIFPKANVYNKFMYFDRNKRTDRVGLPIEAQDFVAYFDQATPEQRMQMDELEFEIDVPDEVIETVDISDIHKCPTLEIVEP